MEVIPNDRTRSGRQDFGPISVPSGIRRVTLTVHRDALTNMNQSLSWGLEFSINAGQSWVSLGGGALDLSRCGQADPRFVDSKKQAAVSGSSRGLLVVHGVAQDGQRYTRWWVSDVLRGETIEAGYEDNNLNRQVRGFVSLAANCRIWAEVDFA